MMRSRPLGSLHFLWRINYLLVLLINKEYPVTSLCQNVVGPIVRKPLYCVSTFAVNLEPLFSLHGMYIHFACFVFIVFIHLRNLLVVLMISC